MGVLKPAFNTVCRLHSRPAMLKRLGTPDIFTQVRTTPSQYFRYLAGPSQTVVPGSEVVIPVATMFGQPQVVFLPNLAPTGGTFKLSFKIDGSGSTVTTGDLDFDADDTDIQLAVRLLTGCTNATVTGSLLTSISILFVGAKSVELASVDSSSLVTTTSVAGVSSYVPWDSLIKRGDKIIDAAQGSFTVKEIIEMPDLGGDIMGYRVRLE